MNAASKLAAGLLVIVLAPAAAVAQECQERFDSTFALIEKAIFQDRGCTSAGCHNATAQGGLDLSPGLAYDNLVDQPVQSIAARPQLKRVEPAKKERSLLWLNLAAATLPDEWKAPLNPMPLGGLRPLTVDELELIRLWIELGAPREGVVPGTDRLEGICLPPEKPLQTKPLDPPPDGEGIQLRAPTQILDPHSEREGCFVTYYDVTDKVPEKFLGPNGDTFRYKRIESRQDPLSHHAVVIPYKGKAAIDDPIWLGFACGGGPRHGLPCEPTDADSCGAGGVCASAFVPSVACIGYGPGDASIGLGNDSLFNTMAAGLGSVEGIYAEAPLKGILVWDSHAFNVTDEPGKLDIWVNLEFAAPEEQQHELRRFTEITVEFGLNIPPFGAQQICGFYQLDPGTRVIELSSHNHKRGRRFQTFRGAFRCMGGPHDGAPCSPFGPDPNYPVADLCAGAPCESPLTPTIGDCDGNGQVALAEVVTGVNMALGRFGMAECPRFDPDGNGGVDVVDLVAAVHYAVEPQRDPNASLLYTSTTYTDPTVVSFDPPRLLAPPGTPPYDRTLTFCGIYENGFLDPTQVKRKSTSQRPESGFPGGPCRTPVACTEGRLGEPCSGSNQGQRDASCDSAPGAGDGSCDACPTTFGVTTDDEMFILLGAFYRE
jgi:hypothetical protein